MFLKIMKILCIEEILLFLKKCFKSFNQKDNLIFKIESIQNNYHKNISDKFLMKIIYLILKN
jgi:hypothetical protein